MSASPIRAVSYGGGVQSTALLVLAAERRIDFPLFLMANVGDDSENPKTIDYVRDVAAPYAAENGIELHVLDRVRRDGTVETLWQRLMNDRACKACGETGLIDGVVCEKCEGDGRVQSRSLPIPVRMSNGAPGTRSCTADFKIRVIGKWLKEHGARGPKWCADHECVTDDCETIAADRLACDACDAGNPATVGVGISLDEIMRANSRRVEPYERVVYPLIGLGEETGLKLNRQDCTQLIRRAGLPVPPKSSCFFCPFHRPSAWTELRREQPELFDKSVTLERTLNDRRAVLGKDPVWLTRFGMPLDQVIGEPDELLPIEDITDADGQCDSGWCFT